VRILFSSTAPVTLERFMEGQLAWIASQGHDVHVVSSPGRALDVIRDREGVRVHALAMERDIAPAHDVAGLVRWVRLLRAVRPDVVVVGTPKAGLLGSTAARLCQVRRRVYLLRGARYESTSGRKRRMLMAMEKMSCSNAHRVVAVSPSLARLVENDEVVAHDKLATVGSGSSNGINLERFHPADAEERRRARLLAGLDDKVVAIAFVGRLHPDKGLTIFEEGLRVLAAGANCPVTLLVAGEYEGAELRDVHGLQIRMLGQVEDIPLLLHATDMLVLPTQREGFPNVVLEAAASGLPVVTTNATGAVDSVVDGVTGLVVDRQDGAALGEAMRRLVNSEELRRSMGAQARTRVESEFANELVWRGMLREYLGVERQA
jgi:glycosyltransferase involved in cell wall biosynthesis